MKITYRLIEATIVGSIFLVPMVAGILAPEPELERTPWVKEVPAPKKVVTKHFRYSKSGIDPYREVDKNTHLWEEFMEEIDNLGFHLWDPDAIEIWETKYQ